MKLKKIVEKLNSVKKIEGKASVEIRGLACDSNKVKKEYLFVAIKGSRFNGVDFINEAIDRGACAIILELNTPIMTFKKGPTYIYVNDAKRALGLASRAFYGDISSNMRLIGVTGTNGKTTITYLLESLLNIKSEKAGIIGTINYRFGNRVVPALNTTPGVLDLYSLLHSMEKLGIKNCILEASSHSLEQGRLDTLQFDIAVFTNLTNEHLDYHGTLENYLASKMKLFTKIKKGGYAVVNRDDTHSGKIIQHVKSDKDINLITYGVNPERSLRIKQEADLYAEDIKCSFDGLRFKLCTRNNSIEIHSSLIGRHNVYNILACASCGIGMGMSLSEIARGIESISALPGRLERVNCGQPFSVFIDYAHTENGLENVLEALRGLKPKRILTVFGCGGDRDRSKRPNMGRISSELSDKTFITSDNPRNEDPMNIINEIKKGITCAGDNYVIEPDRFKAIDLALKEAKRGDIVLVAGKGHETYQIFKDVVVPFADKEVVRRILGQNSGDNISV
ncbi:MAG: UDP-N-acetylmuramoyl-L-alanyl-D-glutamate--2,6-diaminopimelate ligase [Candidatus Omnitrophica bacterium]|nr:UDP-N-acetylmuramoyl-L-alanyl-D-glutamate--2,6-diaminopimelate ligase [Candidatus Omnitrophota bacterium]